MTRPSVIEDIELHLKVAPDEGWFTDMELHKSKVQELFDYITSLEADLTLLAELRQARKEYDRCAKTIGNWDLVPEYEELNRLRDLVELGE